MSTTTGEPDTTTAGPITFPRRAGRSRARRVIRVLAMVAVLGLGLSAIPTVWVEVAANGHIHELADAPAADVAIVFGAQLSSADQTPLIMLAERLRTGAELVKSGKAKVLLVSGDAHGSSGNETAAMTRYLVGLGVDESRIVIDPDGLDTYDTCVRAHQVFGVTRALLVTQRFHLPRAITLCDQLGVEAEGVNAGHCSGCQLRTKLWNPTREYAARGKALYDLASGRGPAVSSPPSSAIADALAATAR